MTQADRVDEFVLLFTRHERRLRAFAVSLMMNTADTEDVLQEAHLALWKQFARFEPGTNFMAWGCRVIHLEVLKHRRRQARDRLRLDPAFLDAVARVTTREPFASELGDRERALRECLATLRPEHRAMLRARYEDGGSIGSVAAVFNRSTQAIYNALFRIRQRLFDCVSSKTEPAVFHGR